MTVSVILTGFSVERCCNIMSRYYRVSARFCAVGVMWYTWQRYAVWIFRSAHSAASLQFLYQISRPIWPQITVISQIR